ncbi:MAG: biotin--[acetyl-CoA-carboxylase] ligase [Desulfobacteraceae bacterium]|nr:biotin--[acetyl-CoA-carboxylase] ligase [Desulfobacteraceae bacterium]
MPPEPKNSTLILPKTSRHIIGRTILHLDEVDSTNSLLLRDEALLRQDGFVIYADRQTSGRGRMNRAWSGGSHGNKHLFCSIVIHPRPFLSHIPSITIILGLAVYRALRPLGVRDHAIKWPNDILVSGRKLCGILCEAKGLDGMDVVVAGIGVNIEGGMAQFPPALRHKAATLEMATGNRIEREHLLDIILNNIDKILAEAEEGTAPLFREWEISADLEGKTVTCNHKGRLITGVARGIDESGGLLIDVDGAGSVKVISGEITLTDYR